MTLVARYTDDALRKVGRNVVNFQRLEHGLKELVRLSEIEGSVSRPQPTFPRQTKRLRRAGLAENVSHFNRALYDDRSNSDTSGDTARFSTRFQLELDSNMETQRRELMALARERNRLVHHELSVVDFPAETACVELSRRLDEQNERVLHYLGFVNAVQKARNSAMQSLAMFIKSEEFLNVLASDEADA